MSVTGSMSRTGNTIDATATVTPYINMPAGMVLHMVITERETRNNFRSNGERRFYDVVKKTILTKTVRRCPRSTAASHIRSA